MYYYLIVYNNYEHTEITSILKFKTVKAIIKFTNGIINYADINRINRKYKTYKTLFMVIRR